MNPGDPTEMTPSTDTIQVLIRLSRRGEPPPSHPTLGPWVGPQSAPPSQAPSSARHRREEKLSGSALQRKRAMAENQNRVYLFKHLPNWEEYIECYKERHQVSSKANPFEARYVGLPQTFISLPQPAVIRTQTRYVEDKSKYPIPIAYDRNSGNFKTHSTPNLCILPGEGSIQLPPLDQKPPSMRQEKKLYSKNLMYPPDPRYHKPNYFVDSTLQALSTSLDVLKFDPPFDPRFKSCHNELRNGSARPATSKKLEKLLVTCQNDSLNLENMIQSLCKFIPPSRPEDPTTDKMVFNGNKLNPPLSSKQSPSPAVDQLSNSLLDQFSYEVNKVDYDSPLDLQFNGRIYHTNLETFLQCLDTKLQSYSKASIEELMGSIHIHTVAPAPTEIPPHCLAPNPADASTGGASKREVKYKIMREDDCKKVPVNLSVRKGKK